MGEYTPDEHELIRGFTARRFGVVERGEREAFSDYLSRASISTAQIQIASEAAARRAIAKVKAEAWDEAIDAAMEKGTIQAPPNPYREEN